MRQYDPKKIVITFGAVLVGGFAEGTFVNAERNEDAYETSVGAAGDVTRVRNRNRTGLVTLTLQSESPTNDLLSALHAADEASGTGVGALFIKDLNGTTFIAAESAWIRKYPGNEYADAGGNREWVIECAELEIFAGGSLVQ